MENYHLNEAPGIRDRFELDTPMWIMFPLFVIATAGYLAMLVVTAVGFGNALLQAGHITGGLGLGNMVRSYPVMNGMTGWEPLLVFSFISTVAAALGYFATYLMSVLSTRDILHNGGARDTLISRIWFILMMTCFLAYFTLAALILLPAIVVGGFASIMAHWGYALICFALLAVPFLAPIVAMQANDPSGK